MVCVLLMIFGNVLHNQTVGYYPCVIASGFKKLVLKIRDRCIIDFKFKTTRVRDSKKNWKPLLQKYLISSGIEQRFSACETTHGVML